MEKLTIDEIIGHCERKTEQYERFYKREYLETMPLTSSAIKEYWEHRQVVEYLRKLKDYEDLEEQGRLVKLPCRVGDNLYCMDSYLYAVIPVRLDEVILQFVGINNYVYQYNCYSFDACGDVYQEYEFDDNDFGKTVFLTKNEAEAKLKELRGEENEVR